MTKFGLFTGYRGDLKLGNSLIKYFIPKGQRKKKKTPDIISCIQQKIEILLVVILILKHNIHYFKKNQLTKSQT